MIVVMKRQATDQDIDAMIKHVESLGMKPVVLRGTERTVIAAISTITATRDTAARTSQKRR